MREPARYPMGRMIHRLTLDVNPVVAGLVATYDVSDTNTVRNRSGNAIIQLFSTPRFGNHTSEQSTSTKRPALAAAQVNGLSSATLDGGDTLALPAALYTLPNGGWTVFVVGKRNTEAGTSNRMVSFTEGGAQRADIGHGSVSGVVNFQSRTAAGAGVSNTGNTNTNYQIMTGFRSGTTQSVQVNNNTAVTNASGASESGVDGGHIGSMNDTSAYLTGGIAEILLYNRALSAAEIIQVNRYLSNKYAITLA